MLVLVAVFVWIGGSDNVNERIFVFFLTFFPFIGQEAELEVMTGSQSDEDSDVEDPLYGFHVSSVVNKVLVKRLSGQ